MRFDLAKVTTRGRIYLALAVLAASEALWIYVPSRPPNNAVATRQIVESAVLIGEEQSKLAFEPSAPVSVRNTYLDDLPQTLHYLPGRDYVLDSGRIRRTPNSRIPDFRTNVLYGKANFNHAHHPRFGNAAFFVYIDYWYQQEALPLIADTGSAAQNLPNTVGKLVSGRNVKIVAFGDSITAGGDASSPKLIFWARWVDELQRKYPNATIEVVNAGTDSDTSKLGLQRLPEKVIANNPDLVLIGFGMNDQNAGASHTFFSEVRILVYQALLSMGVSSQSLPTPSPLADNLREMIDRIRAQTQAEIILLSAFPPNPKWLWSSGYMPIYAAQTEHLAREQHCAYADVYRLWSKFAEHKKPEDFLNNNINHPNDFGHWLYFQALAALNL